MIVCEEFGELRGAESVIIYGSWAARHIGKVHRRPNDLDVMVVGSVYKTAAYDCADRVRRRTGFDTNVVVQSMDAWTDNKTSFIAEVRSRPYVVVAESGRSA